MRQETHPPPLSFIPSSLLSEAVVSHDDTQEEWRSTGLVVSPWCGVYSTGSVYRCALDNHCRHQNLLSELPRSSSLVREPVTLACSWIMFNWSSMVCVLHSFFHMVMVGMDAFCGIYFTCAWKQDSLKWTGCCPKCLATSSLSSLRCPRVREQRSCVTCRKSQNSHPVPALELELPSRGLACFQN